MRKPARVLKEFAEEQEKGAKIVKSIAKKS